VLRIKETLLLDAVIRWGKAEVKRQVAAGTSKLDPKNDEDVAKVLVNILPLVRVHTMSIQDIIAQREVLTAALGTTKLLNLFTYCGLSKDSRISMASSFTDFVGEARKGVSPLAWTIVSSQCTLSNDNKTITTNCSTWGTNAVANQPDLIDDWYSYKLKLTSGGTYLMMGWALPTISMTTSTYSSSGYYLYQSSGTLYGQNSYSGNSYASASFTSGMTITSSYSPSKGQIKFAYDGVDKGVAYNGVSGDLVPALNFDQPTTCTIAAVDEE